MHHTLNPDNGTFLLRISLGTVLLAHSLYLKMMVFTLAGTAQFFVSIGLPALLAYVVFFLELVCGLALIVGYKTRFVSALIVPVLLGATWAHLANGWLFTNTGGGWEYPLMLTIMAISQLCLGSGRFAFAADRPTTAICSTDKKATP